jgi:hypothetical protein
MGNNKIDITSTVLEKTLDLAKGFIEKLTGAAIEETGLLISDNIKLKRFKNQLSILVKAQKIVADSGINIKQISLKALVPLLEYSSLEDDESLQDKWTNLLVNFIDSNEKYESTIFPFILNQLSSDEVIELDNMYNKKFVNLIKVSILSGVTKSNFIRLGLAEIVIDTSSKKAFATHYTTSKPSRVKITELGCKFVECCSPRTMI